MKYLKTYEGLFDFFKKKEVVNKTNDRGFLFKHLEDVKDCFLDISYDKNLTLYVSLPLDGNEINVELDSDEFIKLEDLMETFRFTDSYITDLSLKINRYELYISGEYDNTNYMGDIYYDNIQELEQDLNKEGTKHIESVRIKIGKI
jgi:hypothetical protein